MFKLSDEVLPVTLIDQYQKDSLFTNNSLFFDSEEYNKLSKLDLAHSENDQAKIIDYGPQYFKIETKTEHQQLLTLYQKNYTGWELTVNGENKELLTSNMNFMTLVLPAGENNVLFEYKNPTIKIAFWISTLTLLAMLISLVWAFHKSRPVKEI